MFDRLLLYIADTITLLSSLLAGFVLLFALLSSATGEAAIGDFVTAAALAVVPYCFAGALHRIVATKQMAKD